MNKFTGAALLVAVAATVASASANVTVSGIVFDRNIDVEGVSMEARGAGLLKYAYFFDIYVGVLYLPSTVSPENVLGDVPKRLEVEYFRGFKGDKFGEAALIYIEKNVSPEEFEELKPRIDSHNALYVDVSEGDRYALDYVPGKGTRLSFNGTPLGTVPGADFARAIFSVWLGKHPISEDFKEALLGGG